jgi:hypothetical protein
MKFKDVKNNKTYVCYNPRNDRMGLWTKHYIKDGCMFGMSENFVGKFLKKVPDYKKDNQLLVLGLL